MDRVGYLVPAAYFDGAVHSVFARACNFACGDSLLTLVARDRADGPTTLRLGGGAPPDLRLHFRPGERVRCRDGIAAAPGVTMRLTGAAIWHPVRPPPLATATQLAANLRFAAAALAHRRGTRSSVIDREGSAVLAGLGAACRALDAGTAAHEVERLIGWGEGLTPAGDDVLVGWRAGLDALVDGEPGRAAFLPLLSAAIVRGASRTTPIAAHCLRLAARGHYNADVIRLRNALLGESDPALLHGALMDALGVGATSGADMVTGMLAGVAAWLEVDALRERGRADSGAELECAPG